MPTVASGGSTTLASALRTSEQPMLLDGNTTSHISDPQNNSTLTVAVADATPNLPTLPVGPMPPVPSQHAASDI